MTDELQEYIEQHISEEPAHLAKLYRHTQLTRLYPRMCSGHIQGRMLKMITQMISPMRVLELGTFTGYSALCMAEGMPEGAELHTVELDDEYADDIRSYFESAPCGGKITLHIGDALELTRQLPGPWDMVFIDANKRQYSEYYKAVLPLVPSGGYIIADNTLWSGKVTEDCHDAQTDAIRRFNDLVAADARVEKVILPLRDGMTIIRKL
ncbi:MAG: O-methyltransferase [Muribaculaceae bacterium]|nr:O-methyltransferase [Muribaculaceae bacterium]MDE7032035.1 O-methyltransferase [Muribaculaceae bacterium]